MPEPKNKILHFLQYHNLTLVILMFIIGFGTASLASDNVRDAIFEKEVKEVGIDNTALLTADIDNFNFQPQITDIQEDENYYYVDYQYRTLGVKDNVWQEIIQEKELEIPKEILTQSNTDLPAYITEEIGEVIMREYQLLKDSQKIAREQGLTKKQKVIAYRGLIGKILNLQPKVIVQNQENLTAQISETENIQNNNNTQQLAVNSQQKTETPNTEEISQQSSSSQTSPSLEDFVDRELIRQIVEEILAQREQENQEVLAINNQGVGNTQSSQIIEQPSNQQTTIEQPSIDEQTSEQASEQISEQQTQQEQQTQEDQQIANEEENENTEIAQETSQENSKTEEQTEEQTSQQTDQEQNTNQETTQQDQSQEESESIQETQTQEQIQTENNQTQDNQTQEEETTQNQNQQETQQETQTQDQQTETETQQQDQQQTEQQEEQSQDQQTGSGESGSDTAPQTQHQDQQNN